MKIGITIFRVLIAIVLIGQISNWFLDYSPETKQLLNTIMFVLIGLFYTIAGIIFNKKLFKAVFILCGLYIIALNFIEKSPILTIIGIISIILPLLLARFSKEYKEDDELLED
ncbi:hypothetical protein [Polaribacter uvawellassae]|uniref:hypothetical protein n=1 Tax=Polaribacter uvawellassae TaxID=3133495 RepID=UPI00321C08E6